MNKYFYQRAMRSLQAQNQNRYSNAYGNGNNGGMGGNSGNELTGTARVFGLIATSTTNAASDAILFGVARHGIENSAGSGTGIAITGAGALAHGEIKILTIAQSWELLELRLDANAAATIPNSIQYEGREAGGSRSFSEDLYPRVMGQSSGTQDTTKAEVDVKGLIIDASTRFVASIAANGTLRFYFVMRAILKPSLALQGRGAIVSTNAPAPAAGAAQRLIVESARLVR